jgi:Tol biopolymer transport system component
VTTWLLHRPPLPPPSPPIPLTSDPGFQWAPSFSPEGTRVAFAWDQPGKRPSNIYVKLIGSSDPVRLTEGDDGDFAPAWSPDGRYIAFLRARGPFTTSVMLMPSLGGPETELTRLHLDTALFFEQQGWMLTSPLLTWSSDNKWLVTVQQTVQLGSVRVVRISVESGEQTPLKLFPDSSSNRNYGSLLGGDAGLALLPDGRTLAFAHSVELPNNSLFVMNLSNDMLPAGAPRSLHFDSGLCAGVAWDPDGQNLVVSADRRGSMELWKVPLNPRRKPAHLNVSDIGPGEIAVSKTAQRLVFTHYSRNSDIWRVDLRTAQLKDAVPFMASTRSEIRPAYSSDGTRIAFESDRTGNEEIWTSNADGSRALQLTSFGNAHAGSPRWSPDDRKIAFDSNAAGKWDVYVVPSQGGKPVRFTEGSGSSIRPSWSHDGKWIYYCASENSGLPIWKKPARGGAAIQLTKNGGCDHMESADGAYVYYLKPDERALWRVPSDGGEESQVLALAHRTQFALGTRGAYFMETIAPAILKYLDFATGGTKVLGKLPGPVLSDNGLAVSPDEHWLLYGKDEFAGSQLMLVEGFR